MKFQDISTITTPAEAAKAALRKESISIDENLSGRSLRRHLAEVQKEIDLLSSKGGAAYTRAILHREVYEDMAAVDAVLHEADLDETDLEQAEVIIAAQSMSKSFQGMIEDAADMLGSDLITLVDQIKHKFGDGAGEQFGQSIRSVLEGTMNTLVQTKDSIDAAISAINNPMAGSPEDNAFDGGDPNAVQEPSPVYPSSSGPEGEPTGRELKSDAE